MEAFSDREEEIMTGGVWLLSLRGSLGIPYHLTCCDERH